MANRKTVDKAAVDKAFETLKTYDWGADRKLLNPIDDAITATHGDAAARKELETRLVAVLQSGASRSAKDFVCRALRTIGTAESVPALAALLPDKDLSHMARYALERIPAEAAGQAFCASLPKLSGALKVGVIGSLGARRDSASVPALAALLTDSDKAIACAAACALGNIGSLEAAKALSEVAKTAPAEVKPAVADACLACAEHLLADGKKVEAIGLYKSLSGEDQPKHVRVAATRGYAAALGKKE
jgi:HEAT repeat protein